MVFFTDMQAQTTERQDAVGKFRIVPAVMLTLNPYSVDDGRDDRYLSLWHANRELSRVISCDVAWWEKSNVRPSMILMLISLNLFEQLNILCKFATVIKNQNRND